MKTKSVVAAMAVFYTSLWLMLLILVAPNQVIEAKTIETSEVVVSTSVPTVKATETETQLPSSTVESTSTSAPTVTPEPTRIAEDWKNWPVIPDSVSNSMKILYQEGLLIGNDPHKFSKSGDCQNIPGWFLSGFDSDSYVLDDASLQETIDWYSPSFERESIAVRGGMNVTSVQVNLWTTDPFCGKSESPITCEIRLNKPSVILFSYEELWDGDYSRYTNSMEKLILYTLSKKVVPILATTATNEKVNQVVADLAVKYELPVWNLWAALQPLSDHGITEDGFHITKWGNIFDLTSDNKSAWTVRNETALKSLDAVRRFLQE